MVILLNLLGFIWMVPMGFQEAFCTVIGNAIGDNNPDLARKYYRLTACIALSAIGCWILSFWIFREYVASVYIVIIDENTRKLNVMFLDGLRVLLLVFLPDAF